MEKGPNQRPTTPGEAPGEMGTIASVVSSKRMSVLDQGAVSLECEARMKVGIMPYLCPIYRTSQRSRPEWQDDFVMGVVLPSQVNNNDIIMNDDDTTMT
eukprot:6121653-Pyramimonas_sp.AAC.1